MFCVRSSCNELIILKFSFVFAILEGVIRDMWTCRKCEKPVYFAERKQSLGYDWHPECLRCEECGKRLNPGQHAEHKGVPYCHIPCYSALFGPTLFGHGSQVESHRSFGKVENRLATSKERSQLESQLKRYNHHYEGKSHEIKCKERNGKLILEGVLRIYWGVNNLIHLKEDDDQRAHVKVRKRNSYRKAIDHGLEDSDSDSPPSTPVRVKRPGVIANATLKAATVTRGNSNTSSEKRPSDECDRASESEAAAPNGTSHKVGTGKEVPDEVPIGKEPCLDSTEVNSLSAAENSVGDPIVNLNSTSTSNGGNDSSANATADVSGEAHANITSGRATIGNNGAQANTCDSGAKDADNAASANKGDAGANSSDSPPIRIRKMASSRSRTKLRRRCSINGHYYDRETSVFKPPYGSASNVWITSFVNCPEVINMLLDKFRVENSPRDFALYIVRDNGETKRIPDHDYPLLVRVMLGPHEDVAKVFVMDNKTNEISNEVAQFLNFTYAELNGILRRYREEEDKEVDKIITKFRDMKYWMRRRMAQLIAQRRQQKEREAAAAAAGNS